MPHVSTGKPIARAKSPVRMSAGGPSARTSSAPVPAMPFEQAATLVLGDLQHAVTELFGAAAGDIRKIADVEKAFGVHHLLAWQLYRVAHAENPLAAGAHVPARVSMEKLLTAAARRKAPPAIIDRVAEAFAAFERLVESDAGGRDEMEAMLNAFLPEERRKQDLASRQAAFKAMSQVRGLAIEAAVVTTIFRPSPDGKMVDRSSINCDLGVRRTRPEAPIVISSGDLSRPSNPVLSLDGAPVDGPHSALLSQYSTSPPPRLETRENDGTVFYRLAGNDVGMRSAIDLVTADRRAEVMRRYHEPGSHRIRGVGNTFDMPAKRATQDVFLHKDLWPGVPPLLAVYSTAKMGVVKFFGDPSREDDLLVAHDEIRALPADLAGARLAYMPRYVELLEYTFGKLGWNPADFRGYRLDVQYPVYASQYCIGFEVPDPPAAVERPST